MSIEHDVQVSPRSRHDAFAVPAPRPSAEHGPMSVAVSTRPGSAYAELSRQIRSAGLLRRRPLACAGQIALTLALFVGACTLIFVLGDSWWQLAAAAVLAVAFTQAAFLGHDGGHQQVFGTRRANDLFGQLIGNLFVGLSYGWWVGKHNRHHANPNKEGHDPDIGDNVLAFTTGQAARKSGRLATAVLRRQAWLFFPLLLLEGFHLHVAGVRSLLPGGARSARGGTRRVEAVLLGTHLIAYVGGLLLVMSPAKVVAFVIVHQALFGLYMGSAFAPNHKGMATFTAEEDVDFLRRQVLTSRNVHGGLVVDWLLGGLNYQTEHHLFPSMPRPSLRRAQPLVRAYCDREEIVYTETSAFGSYRAALSHLNSLGRDLRD